MKEGDEGSSRRKWDTFHICTYKKTRLDVTGSVFRVDSFQRQRRERGEGVVPRKKCSELISFGGNIPNGQQLMVQGTCS